MTTDKGRDAIKALAYKVARSKTALDEMGKELGQSHYKAWKAIAAERGVICDRLDALRDEVRAPLTAWEDAETARVNEHERALVTIIESPRNVAFAATLPSANVIEQRIAAVREIWSGRDWQEFNDRAASAVAEALGTLEPMLSAAKQAERDAAELAELRRMKAERETADLAAATAKAEADRKAQEAADAAESERLRAEQQKAREAELERRQDEALARVQAAAAANAAAEIALAHQKVRDAEAATAKAVEDERQRVAAVAAAEKAAADKREANKKHRAKVNNAAIEALIAKLHFNETVAREIVTAIAKGDIPHVSISY
jgi:hypothetical protein